MPPGLRIVICLRRETSHLYIAPPDNFPPDTGSVPPGGGGGTGTPTIRGVSELGAVIEAGWITNLNCQGFWSLIPYWAMRVNPPPMEVKPVVVTGVNAALPC